MTSTKAKNNHLDLFYELVRTDFVMRYNNSVLGFTWVLLKPLLLFAIIVFIFSWFFQSTDPLYRYNLLLGIILFSYLSEATKRGVVSLFEKSKIILKVNFPKVLAIYTSVFNSFISFFFSMLAYLIFWLFTKGANGNILIFYFLLQVTILTMLITGISFFVSILYPKFRDLLSIWEILLRLLFYFTPIIYPVAMIPDKYQKLFFLNPLAVIVTESRKAIISGQSPSWPHTFYVLFISLVVLISGYFFFNKKVRSVAESL